MSVNGWIKLSRDLVNHDLWQERPFTRGQAWVDLIMLANHKDGFIRVAGEKITILRGQCGWSQLRLSSRWGWSRGKVARFFNDLKAERMIDTKQNNRNTIVTICNYDKFQSKNNQDDTTDETPNSTTDGHQTVQQTDTNKNVKNDKKERSIGVHFDKWPAKPSQQVLADFKKNRKAAFTQTAIDRMAGEIHKAVSSGLTVDDCLSVCCEAGWQGFKYEWYLNRERNNAESRSSSRQDKHTAAFERLKSMPD